jgi:hypothetical protein
MEDEAEAVVTGLTLDTPGLPPGWVVATCPTASTPTDGDGDGIPTSQTLTFANPPCTLTPFRGGTFAITGTVKLEDTTTADATSFRLTDTDLAWIATDPATTRTFTATRNGTRSRTGSDSTATLVSTMTIVRQRPGRANTTINLSTTVAFTSDSDTVKVLSQLPSGSLDLSGTMTWHRSTENWSLGIATPIPLAFDPTCNTTPQRIRSGQLSLSGTISGEAGVLTITFNGCGNDPTPTWTPNP